MRLDRLTYVHNGDHGTIGRLIGETKGVLRFGSDGSGLIEIGPAAVGHGSVAHGSVAHGSVATAHGSVPAVPANSEAVVRIASVAYSSLAPDVRHEIGADHVPCLLGHSGVTTVTLLSTRSCARVSASLSDLRGKVRFALARLGWEL